MKRIIAFILILCLCSVFASCDFGSDPKESASQESSSVESSCEQSSSGNQDSPDIEQHPSSSKEEESTSSEQGSSSEEISSSKGNDDSAVITPVVTEYGAFSSSATKTNQATDRLRQMSQSRKAYNAGAAYTEEQLNKALSNAKLIKSAGGMLGYRNASALIDHFIGNTGEIYNINMTSFLADANAKTNQISSLNEALRACEALCIEGESISIFEKEERVHHNLSGDWHYAIGSYFSSVEIQNLSFDGKEYSATFVYKVTDYYNWEPSDTSSVFSGTAGALTGNISPKDLHQLHRAGMAREFLSEGKVSYSVTWTKGANATTVFEG